MTKKKTTRTVARKKPVKRATTRKTTARKTTSANPFKGADLVLQKKTTYNIQKVVVGANGLSVKSKSVRRTKANDAKFAQLKKTRSK